MDQYTNLLPVEVCNAVIAALDDEPARTRPDIAHDLTKRLLGCYPGLKAHDPHNYTAAIVAVFCAYPLSVGQKVADPVTGLASRLKFDPKPADLKEALEGEMVSRRLIRANALWHIQEADERVRVAAAEKEWAACRPSAAERAAQAEKVLQEFRFREWPTESTQQSPDLAGKVSKGEGRE